MRTRIATCRCGAAAIEAEGKPIANQLCHCASCRRRTGGPCGWTAVFRAEQFRVLRGDFTIYRSNGDVGPTANSFCSACGTTLFFVPEAHPGIVGCAGGCFTDDPLGEPTASMSDDQRCAWLALPDGWTKRGSAEAARR